MSLVMAASAVVYCSSTEEAVAGEPAGGAAKKAGGDDGARPDVRLTDNAAAMRDMILAAVEAGKIEDLKLAIDWNELPPEFGDAARSDPITHWKKTSADGEGLEVLALLANILALPPARMPIGADPENNIVYVWPYLAERPLGELMPAERIDLYRLMPADQAKRLIDSKKWTWWRLAIGADGTWLTFMKHD